MLDLHVHLIGHLDRKATSENIKKYLDVARVKGLKSIGFADHDMYWKELNFELIRETAQDYPDLDVRVGLEVDYREGAEKKISEMLSKYDFDYVIGSVHEINGWMFDMPEEEKHHQDKNPDIMYKNYFKLIEKTASSGLFSTIGHLDLIKIFGVRPLTDVRELAAKALDAIEKNSLTVEINTNGRYKPVGEFYPELKIIKEIIRRGIPITLGSDAHQPETVGRDIWEVCEILLSLGINEVTGFKKRREEVVDIIVPES